MSQVHDVAGRAHGPVLTSAPRPPTPVRVAAGLLVAGAVVALLRAVLGAAVLVADGRLAGPYVVGAVVAALLPAVILVLLGRGVRRRQPRMRLWTTVVAAFAVLISMRFVLAGADPVDRVAGAVNVLGSAVVVVLLFLPVSSRWFGDGRRARRAATAQRRGR